MPSVKASPADLAANHMAATEQVDTVNPDYPDRLQALIARIEEAMAAYDEMIPRADDDIVPLLRRWFIAHDTHRDRLVTLLGQFGQAAEGGSSVMQAVQRGVIATRDAVTGLDESALSNLLSGEDNIQDAYGDALALAPGAHKSVLLDQRQTLRVLAQETQDRIPD